MLFLLLEDQLQRVFLLIHIVTIVPRSFSPQPLLPSLTLLHILVTTLCSHMHTLLGPPPPQVQASPFLPAHYSSGVYSCQATPAWPGHYQPQDLQPGPGTPGILCQEETTVVQTMNGKKKKKGKRKGRQSVGEGVDQEYEAAFRAYLAEHNLV